MKYISKKTFLVLMIFVSIISVLTYFVYFFNQPAKAYISQTNSSASLVIGQADFASNLVNQGGVPAANTLNQPFGLAAADGQLIISDEANHRALIYNSIPAANNISADVVIGQPDMASNSANQGGAGFRNANTLYSPRGLLFAEGKLLVADSLNHRVLIFNSLPTSNNASANVVIGQADFVSGSANQGGAPAANTLNVPRGVYYVAGKLFIADTFNHRVLIYNSIPAVNNVSADLVIGQPDMVSNSANQGGSPAANTLSQPREINYDASRLYITDMNNNRVLIYNSIPAANDASANVVIGQSDMVSNTANQGGSPAANTLDSPINLLIYGQRLFLTDVANNRLLIYLTLPTANNASANVVIGQSDFVSNLANQGASPAANTFSGPRQLSISSSSSKLMLVDTLNNRALFYNLGPINLSMIARMSTEVGESLRHARLSLSAEGVYQMMISNYSDFREGAWESYAETKDWTLIADSPQTVYAKFRDYGLFESAAISAITGLPSTGADSNWLFLALLMVILLVGILFIIFNSLHRRKKD